MEEGGFLVEFDGKINTLEAGKYRLLYYWQNLCANGMFLRQNGDK
jgi:hypothetical protein